MPIKHMLCVKTLCLKMARVKMLCLKTVYVKPAGRKSSASATRRAKSLRAVPPSPCFSVVLPKRVTHGCVRARLQPCRKNPDQGFQPLRSERHSATGFMRQASVKNSEFNGVRNRLQVFPDFRFVRRTDVRDRVSDCLRSEEHTS